MTQTSYLAFDLGAESGRAVLAHLDAGVVRMDEIHRFANIPLADAGTMRWDVRALWREMRHALSLAADTPLSGIAVDSWGVDYALLSAEGKLLENPYHYRDARNAPAMADALAIVPREEIYAATGVQLIPINTIYQLFAASRRTPAVVEAAERFVMIPDLFNYWLTGEVRCEYTDASTTQLMNPRTRTWAVDLMAKLDLPARLTAPIAEAGSIIGPVQPDMVTGSSALAGTPVVASASHDTASAVAAITARDGTAFISSGTWSLVGTELDEPVLTQRAMHLNFSNEGGVAGTTRLLKNVMGLWLLQGCRRSWAQRNRAFTYAELMDAAAREPGFRHLIDPDDASFANPDDMTTAIDRFCSRTDQPTPLTPGAYARTVFDSLALKYRLVIRDLQSVIERPIARIRVIGGGSRNALLNQLTADATRVPVVAGPVEATALGNVAVQMLATGAAGSLAEARAIIDRSVATTVFTPRDPDAWDREAVRFQQYCGLLYA
jgi:sugar (pentulose or hexulose) kinase